MVRYAAAKLFSTPDKTAIARGSNVRTSFKNMREVGGAIQGLNLKQAYKYLNAVLEHKDCIPFRRYSGGVGRTAQASKHGTSQGRWPEKSVKHIIRILKNAEANAEQKTMDGEALKIRSVVVQQAQKNHRRTYRAHGRINRYDGHPCHVEVILTTPTEHVPRNKDKDELKGLSRQRLARKRLLAIRAPPAAAEA
ncbi:hypothetical protein M407DRAFT_246462 [Tulasnella calospora MUT 4182]|uniref:Ribosomal protein L22 n=1 Tax=Tulasnella calospora MUT 4182 TaxID=1051891 RepID=A0A0C3Q5U6_9AGAM|nr:hypothetical protein M407DRAFT_246462 [Tulasnella calospora MUT 4182]